MIDDAVERFQGSAVRKLWKIGQGISGVWTGPERLECDLGTGGECKVSWLERDD